MKVLLDEYKETIRATRGMERELRSAIEKSDSKDEKTLQELDRKIVSEMVSSLDYCIHCIRYNAEPLATRGIERRAYYEREIPFENQWIQRRKDDESSTLSLVIDNEKAQEVEYEQEIRRELVREIKKCLTPRQIEVMELVGMDFTTREIAEMLGITKRAVNYTIEIARKKVKDEGWRMV